MKYRITAHRRTTAKRPDGNQGQFSLVHSPMEPISFNADTLAEMRAAILKAQGTRFAYRVTVSCYLAAMVQDSPLGEWREVNP